MPLVTGHRFVGLVSLYSPAIEVCHPRRGSKANLAHPFATVTGKRNRAPFAKPTEIGERCIDKAGWHLADKSQRTDATSHEICLLLRGVSGNGPADLSVHEFVASALVRASLGRISHPGVKTERRLCVNYTLPVVMAKPALMTAAGNAMTAKVFDEIGVAVDSRHSGRRSGDPVLIGRIRNPSGPDVSFYLGWYFDPSEL